MRTKRLGEAQSLASRSPRQRESQGARGWGEKADFPGPHTPRAPHPTDRPHSTPDTNTHPTSVAWHLGGGGVRNPGGPQMGCSSFHGNALPPPPPPLLPSPSSHLFSHLCGDNQPVPWEPAHPPPNHPPSFWSSPSLFPPPLSALPDQPTLEAALSQDRAPSRQPLEVEALRAHVPHTHTPPTAGRKASASSRQGPRFLSGLHHTWPSAGQALPRHSRSETTAHGRHSLCHVAQALRGARPFFVCGGLGRRAGGSLGR